MKELDRELRAYYSGHTYKIMQETDFLQPLFDKLDRYAAANPGLSPMLLKAAQYEIIAGEFTPVLFRHSPFFAEMGMKAAEYDGVPRLAAGGWLFLRNAGKYREAGPEDFEHYHAAGRQGIHLTYGPYADYDHHCFPFANVIEHGLEYFYRQAETQKPANREEAEFLEAAGRGLLAVKKIAEKFAEAADHMDSKYSGLIAGTAREVPWRKPETFYEGLQALWFLHEVCASIEGIGMSVIGHVDRLLEELYRRDIESGRLNRDEAYDLICRFLLHTDSKLDPLSPVNESYNRKEQGDTLILGGCDAEGREVFNDITRMILEAHRELNLIYPKIHCRISAKSSTEYLNAANRDFLSGRNVISFLSDDVLIPAQVATGKSLADARGYVAGGCWETITESCEHSAGANCYFNLARVMDLSIHDSRTVEAETGERFGKIDNAADFEQVYRIVMDNTICALRNMCGIIGRNGRCLPQVNPAPFFSACLKDCLINRRDYTAGGGRYNPHGVPLAGLAVFVDSLLTIRRLCFEERFCTLPELLTAVRVDWQGYEILRTKALQGTFWGDGEPESGQLAARIVEELRLALDGLTNERGGPFQLGIYNYRDILDWAVITRATPDGRRAGDFLTQGLTPSRLRKSGEVTNVINSCAALGNEQCPANSVLTISLARRGVTENILAGLERAFARAGGMLQLNCINPDELREARVHPEKHQDLIVRLYGYSARFVTLTPEMQEEFVSRSVY